jgi:hypothetical protein
VARSRRTTHSEQPQTDLFSLDPAAYLPMELGSRAWPDPARFPVNHAGGRVRQQVWADLTRSISPTVIAGFSSIGQLIELIAAWANDQREGSLRVLLGSEPFATERSSFASAESAFTEEVRKYWLEEHGISLRSSAKVVQAIDLLDAGRLRVSFVHGRTRLHAKVYVGDNAATVGSSNFTSAGLGDQIEANARFERGSDSRRYDELAQVAENLWSVGTPWDDQFRALLMALLRFVSWQEALARACADLLEGDWAARYLAGDPSGKRLWPSQVVGIAQALWIAENVGSVLVADATGSGKTRMGAHLARAVRDRLWSTGRVRRDLTVLVCPPAVEDTWYREAVSCGLTINTVSHGLLSRSAAGGPRAEEEAVRQAQILAVDESHNFLSRGTNRTRQVRDSLADHVLLFTATPINRGAADLLQLVGLLGADNFDDETLAVLERLNRRRGTDAALSAAEQDKLRREIQRFTVRRTKTALNELVDREPDAYRHPDTNRICRYPRHDANAYDTGETANDERVAHRIRELARSLTGVAQLEAALAVPKALRNEYTDERWLQFRLASSKGLAAHHVLGAMRSSRAALVEHLAGTVEAANRFNLSKSFKAQPTGNVIDRLSRRSEDGPPEIALDCDVPTWLTDAEAWRDHCLAERDSYTAMLDAAAQLSPAREQCKADLLSDLSKEHPRVLAFDHHLITLTAIEPMLHRAGRRVIVATGANKTNREIVEQLFARDSHESAIALCSDAMNEGLNLQGASAIVHLDLPTTLRVAEQRVGRVDRMDSPYDAIEAWWPRDGEAFATRANELLAERAAESNALLGSNLPMPNLADTPDAIVDLDERIAELESAEAETWDGIRDALDPVRRLTSGPHALITPRIYEEYRHTAHRVVARVSPVRSTVPWAFFAIAGTAHGAPRWLLLEGASGHATFEIDSISDRLRTLLADDPPSRAFDELADHWLNTFLTRADRVEPQLLPRRMQRALDQMRLMTSRWATDADRLGISTDADRWRALSRFASTDDERAGPDPYLFAQRWLELVAPALEAERAVKRRAPYLVLKDINARLATTPLEVSDVEREMTDLPVAAPLERRVSACILGVPDPSTPEL